MDILTNPVILFFIFGILAGLLKSSLEIPNQISKFLSYYLLIAIGIKGGVALSVSGLTYEIASTLTIAIVLASVTPIFSYMFLKRYLNTFDAASVAATYGSISAVTFITASQFLTSLNVDYDEFMSAAMAIMELPAIVIAVLIANKYRQENNQSSYSLIKDSFLEGPNFLLITALLIGMISGVSGYELMKPFTVDLFTGLLAIFLLDMGIQVAKNISEIREKSPVLIGYAIIAPLIHALFALGLCIIFGIESGNTVLLMTLAASASYIAVPAAVKHAIPEASPSIYLGLSLGITFPFNVVFGIPLYYWIVNL